MKRTKNWTKQDAEAFIIGCLVWIGPGFHPDTPMIDYVTGDGNLTFNASEARINQVKMNMAWELLGESIYDILTEWGIKMGLQPAMEVNGYTIQWNGYWGKWMVDQEDCVTAQFLEFKDAVEYSMKG